MTGRMSGVWDTCRTKVAKAQVDCDGTLGSVRLSCRGRRKSDASAYASAHTAQATSIECPEQAERRSFSHLDENERIVDCDHEKRESA